VAEARADRARNEALVLLGRGADDVSALRRGAVRRRVTWTSLNAKLSGRWIGCIYFTAHNRDVERKLRRTSLLRRSSAIP